MDKKWVLVNYWTNDGVNEVVAWVGDIAAEILNKEECEFVCLHDVRRLDYIEPDELGLEFDDEDECCDCGCQSEKEETAPANDDEKMLQELVDEIEEESDFEDEDELEEVIVRQEDDVDYGTDSTLYLKREYIISIAPIRPDFAEIWNATLGNEDAE